MLIIREHAAIQFIFAWSASEFSQLVSILSKLFQKKRFYVANCMLRKMMLLSG